MCYCIDRADIGISFDLISNYPLHEQLLCVTLLLLATDANCEHLCALKRLKTAVRNCMGQARLNSLPIMNVYRELTDRIDSQRITITAINARVKTM